MAGFRPDWGFSRDVLSVLRNPFDKAVPVCLVGHASTLPGLVETAPAWPPNHVYGFWTGLVPARLAVPLTVAVCAVQAEPMSRSRPGGWPWRLPCPVVERELRSAWQEPPTDRQYHTGTCVASRPRGVDGPSGCATGEADRLTYSKRAIETSWQIKPSCGAFW
ncbi:hypothetical protein [Streptomyces sp. NPDC001222]|uniref:hypothetical protein n=1 Tax=Streptomyces sp. NPDC001222 TaxID=3364548 RepID=UPI0036738E9E